jgi:hypothetical protein
MLAVTEAPFGQMYLVAIVALLVGKFRHRRIWLFVGQSCLEHEEVLTWVSCRLQASRSR